MTIFISSKEAVSSATSLLEKLTFLVMKNKHPIKVKAERKRPHKTPEQKRKSTNCFKNHQMFAELPDDSKINSKTMPVCYLKVQNMNHTASSLYKIDSTSSPT
jgi:hypothetical protein